jgi:hypothetical protein
MSYLSGERGKEAVVDGWGSWNFFLNGPYLCRLERKKVCFLVVLFLSRASLYLLGWIVLACVELS